MLQDILTVVRTLLDEAYEADELKHTTTLSKLASTLESAILHAEEVKQRYILRSEIVKLAAGPVNQILTNASARLSATDYSRIANILCSVIPEELPTDPACQRILEETRQVRTVFDKMVEVKNVMEVNRLAQMLVTKSRLLTRHQIAAGLLIDVDQLPGMQEPFIAAGREARVAIGKAKWDPLIDQLVAEANRADA